MVQEELTVTGLSTAREPSSGRPVDPVRVVVHAILAIYLLPVLVLVGAIGGAAVAFQWLAGLISKIRGSGRESLVSRQPSVGRIIGRRPLAVNQRKRSRIIR